MARPIWRSALLGALLAALLVLGRAQTEGESPSPSPVEGDVPPSPAAVDAPPSPTEGDAPPTPVEVDGPPSPAVVGDTPPSPAGADAPPSPAGADAPPAPTDGGNNQDLTSVLTSCCEGAKCPEDLESSLNEDSTILNVTGWGLSCAFPTEALANIPTLELLYMGGNNFTGEFVAIANGLAPLTSLLELDLSGSAGITGPLSAEVDGVQTGACTLVGVGSENMLEVLAVNNTGIQGGVPACLFSQASALRVLYARGNGLTSLPDTFSSESKIETLDLANNKLSGTVPSGLLGHPALKFLNLADNNLEALVVPAPEGQSKALAHLDVGLNQLKESNLLGLASYPELAFLMLANNSIEGELPDLPEGSFPKLQELELGFNKLSGSIAASWGSIGVFKLDKPLEGAADPNYHFDIQFNDLTGDLPEFLSTASLEQRPWVMIHLEGNQLTCPAEGFNLAGVCPEVPSSPSQPDESPSPLPEDSPAPEDSPSPQPEESPAPAPPAPAPTSSGGDSGLSSGAIAGIVIAVLAACGIVAGFMIYSKRRHLENQGSLFGGANRFDRFEGENDDFAHPPRDLEMAGQRNGTQRNGTLPGSTL